LFYDAQACRASGLQNAAKLRLSQTLGVDRLRFREATDPYRHPSPAVPQASASLLAA